jgi:hypothetical protein
LHGWLPAEWAWQVANHFDGDRLTRGQFRRPGCPRDPVADLQFAIRSTVYQDWRHSPERPTVPGDLPLQLDRIGSDEPRGRQSQSSWIDIQELSGHIAILTSFASP